LDLTFNHRATTYTDNNPPAGEQVFYRVVRD
jgi:hypothetical protein